MTDRDLRLDAREDRPGPVKRTVIQGGRAKAYRPLPPSERRAALARGLAAYEVGDFFLAHEVLEPAWMGTDDPGERDVLQGIIKLSAAFVHAARGNPKGLAKNLRGARDRLATPASIAAGPALGLDIRQLAERIGERLVVVERALESDERAGALLAVRIPRAGGARDEAVPG